MQSTTLSKYRNRARTLTFGLEKQADFFSKIKEIETPFFCQICDVVMSNNIDTEAYDRVGCCRACESDFAEINLKSWNEGVRPTSQEIEIKKQERNSLLMHRYLTVENENANL